MRTTFDLNDELLRQVKRHAADERVSVKELVERGLRLLLKRPGPRRKRYKLELKTIKSGFRPGVPSHDFAALQDYMDGLS